MKNLFILILFLISAAVGNSQPPICGQNPAMTSFCKDACIICDIDGFTGRNNSNIVGQAPPGFCTSVVHHMQWIGFIAGSTSLTLSVKVSNCTSGPGLEIGLYHSQDCANFSQISECDTDIKNGETKIFTNTVPLVIGQYYYFVMDGGSGDICDYTVHVLQGSTKAAPLLNAPLIDLLPSICQNDSTLISTPGLSGATYYTWTIDGIFASNKASFYKKFEKPGKYQICLDASNVCDKAPQACQTIEIIPTSSSEFNQQICFGECFHFNDKDYCESNTYPIILQAHNGCDSIVYLNLVVDDRVTASTKLNMCEGDSLSIGGEKLFTPGHHNVVIDNQEGCNIYLDVDLQLIICNIQTSHKAEAVLCNAANDGVIHFSVNAGTPPFSYQGFKIENASIVFDGNISAINEEVIIQGVDEGNYHFTIEDTFGNSKIIDIFVTQPPLLTLATQISDYNGFAVSCYGTGDATIALKAHGGVGPYSYFDQNSNPIQDSIFGLTAGDYTYFVKDKNGCQQSISMQLNQPDSIIFNATFTDPSCDGLTTGQILTNEISGGISPYLFTLNDKDPQNRGLYSQLTEGQYRLKVVDQNGCTKVENGVLYSPEIPNLSVIDSIISINLGDSIELKVISNLTEQTVNWTPSDGVSCPNCLVTYVFPTDPTHYFVTVTSKDGCSKIANIEVNVEKIRSFVISNVLTSNGDHINDLMRYNTKNDVVHIAQFSIYDRWGNLVFNGIDLPKGWQEIPWDGKFNGIDVMSGIYTWTAQVLYIDDVSIQYHGSLNLIR